MVGRNRSVIARTSAPVNGGGSGLRRALLIVLALARIDDLAEAGGTPPEVTERLRAGYQALLGQVDRRLEALSDSADGRGSADRSPADLGAEEGREPLDAEVELRHRVITVERDELDRLVAKRKVSREVASEIRSALDIDETTMRP